MWLTVGLGNPGPRYAGNRHNAGFMVVDELARRHGLGPFRSKMGGEWGSGLVAGEKTVLLKPMEFMNLSGYAVSRAAKFHDVEPERIVVVHDEIDLDLGRLKLKRGGGHGGHNGLRSLVEQLGSRDFLRVRVGVGKPPGVSGADAGDRRVSGWVLSDFPSDAAREVEDLLDRAADAVEAILARGIEAAMNDFNQRNEPKSETTVD
jgi:peptidyl-tRNA hydrolase, PTH1 family